MDVRMLPEIGHRTARDRAPGEPALTERHET